MKKKYAIVLVAALILAAIFIVLASHKPEMLWVPCILTAFLGYTIAVDAMVK